VEGRIAQIFFLGDEHGLDGDDPAEPAARRASANRRVGQTRVLVRAQQRVPRPRAHADLAVAPDAGRHALRDRRDRLRRLRLRAWLWVFARGPRTPTRRHGCEGRIAPKAGRAGVRASIMASRPDLLTQYGVAASFFWAFAVQAGAPAPAVPMLLGAGELSGTGRMNLASAIAAAMAATVVADVVWYSLGRSHGTRVLALLCRFSLDPDSLIRHAKERFSAHRLRYLVLAKFLPGVNPLAAGLAGAVPIR